VKTASDIYAPVSGEVTEVNKGLVENPALVNSEPYAGGWFFKVRLANPGEVNSLLGPDQYAAQIGGA
ncbi:MAG TPA: glycine cleavage system protein H, partial [Verrucomicrobiae bacterium]|nr:glycine cleavage system protein H [Verrucomicrobiae bacterium]